MLQDTKEQFEVPYDGELECKQHIVVYDGTTDSLSNSGNVYYQIGSFLMLDNKIT